jgi:hypothetical protein
MTRLPPTRVLNQGTVVRLNLGNWRIHRTNRMRLQRVLALGWHPSRSPAAEREPQERAARLDYQPRIDSIRGEGSPGAYCRSVAVDLLPTCTKDIDADVAAAIHESWSAEGVDLTRRRVNKKKSEAASERFHRTYPDLVRTLASRYEQVGVVKLSDTGYLGLWMYYHRDDLLVAWKDS